MIVKYKAAPDGAPSFELDVDSVEEAVARIKQDFRGSGEVRLLIEHYDLVSTTPYIIKT